MGGRFRELGSEWHAGQRAEVQAASRGLRSCRAPAMARLLLLASHPAAMTGPSRPLPRHTRQVLRGVPGMTRCGSLGCRLCWRIECHVM